MCVLCVHIYLCLFIKYMYSVLAFDKKINQTVHHLDKLKNGTYNRNNQHLYFTKKTLY